MAETIEVTYCPNCKGRLDQVSDEDVYVCRKCNAQFQIAVE